MYLDYDSILITSFAHALFLGSNSNPAGNAGQGTQGESEDHMRTT